MSTSALPCTPAPLAHPSVRNGWNQLIRTWKERNHVADTHKQEVKMAWEGPGRMR